MKLRTRILSLLLLIGIIPALYGQSKLTSTEDLCDSSIIPENYPKVIYVDKPEKRDPLYLPAIKYYTKACEHSCPGFCRDLAIHFFNDKASKPAVNFSTKGCQLEDAVSCFILGLIYYDGKLVKQDFSQSLKYFKKGCESDFAESCFFLGDQYSYGLGVNQDFFKAFQLNQKACELGYLVSCRVAAGIMYLEFAEDLKLDSTIAIKLASQACNSTENDGLACFLLGVMYYQEKSIKDYFKSANYFERSCNQDMGASCNYLGIMYGKGHGVRQDFKTAKQYFGKACDFGSQSGCSNYATLNLDGL